MKSLKDQAQGKQTWKPTSREMPRYIPTGSPGLDAALGGGWVRGQVATIYFAAASEPERLLLATMLAAQKRQQTIGIISTIMLDLELMRLAELNLSTIHVARVADLDEIEEALRVSQRQKYDILIVDSLDVVLTEREGLDRWRELQQMMRRMRNKFRSSNTATLVMRMMNERALQRTIPHVARDDDRAVVVVDCTKGCLKVRVAHTRTDTLAVELMVHIDHHGVVNLPRELKRMGFTGEEAKAAREILVSRDG